jgi:hypothetical protein
MVERRVTGIVWRQIQPTDIELFFADGESEHVHGTHAYAAELARAADLRIVETAVGTVRWIQQLPKAPGDRRPGGRPAGGGAGK